MDPEDRSPFTPPPSSLCPTVFIAMALVAVVIFAGWYFESRWTDLSTETTAHVPVALPFVSGEQAPPSEAPARRVGQSAPRVEPESPLAWVRCEVNGRVVYSDRVCAGAGVHQGSSADTQAALSTLSSGADGKKTTTIYRCKRFSGAVFWSSARCDQKDALIDRMVSVPRGLSLPQQVRLAEGAKQKNRPSAAEPLAQSPSRSLASTASVRQIECQLLDDRIRRLDAEARQPLSAQRQDGLRGQRKAERDRQFALKC